MVAKAGFARFVPIAAGLLAGTVPAYAQDGQRLSISGKAYEHGGNAGITFVSSLNGNLNASGPVFRADASYGASDSNSGATNERLRGDLLLGYQIAHEDWKTRFYTGVSYIERTGPGSGERNGAGVIFRLEALNSRKSKVFAAAGADYATRDNAYRVSARAAVRAGPVFVGPEFSLIGNDYYQSKQVGLVVDNIKIGELTLALKGGYSFGSDEGSDRDSPYVGLGAAFQF